VNALRLVRMKNRVTRGGKSQLGAVSPTRGEVTGELPSKKGAPIYSLENISLTGGYWRKGIPENGLQGTWQVSLGKGNTCKDAPSRVVQAKLEQEGEAFVDFKGFKLEPWGSLVSDLRGLTGERRKTL